MTNIRMRTIDIQFGNFGRQLAEREFHDIVEVRNAGSLEKRSVQFGQEHIDLELEQVQTQIERISGAWVEGIGIRAS